MNEFDTASHRVLTWFKVNGGIFRDDLLEIKDLRSKGAGRGIVAIKDIPKETILFTIPRDLILSVETSDLSRKVPDIFAGNDTDLDEDDLLEPLDSWAQLILVLLYEYLQGDASKWKPYFDVLPGDFDTPIFWSSSELKELEGTCLTREKIGKEESDSMLSTKILPIIKENASVFYPDGAILLQEGELLTLAHRMGSTIMAYAFDLENENETAEDEEDGWVEDREGKTMLGMVPLADTLNANASFNAHVDHGDSLEITALRSVITAGSEILNYYGPLPTSELLRRYGYLTDEHHRYDVVELPWTLVRASLAKHLGLSEEVLQKADGQFEADELEDCFVIDRDAGNPDEEGQLTSEVRLVEISPELEDQFKAYFKALKKCGYNSESDKRKREDVYNIVLADALVAKLESYPTTLQYDEMLLFGPNTGSDDNLTKRHQMAIEVRLGEKILLQEALALCGAREIETGHFDLYQKLKKSKR